MDNEQERDTHFNEFADTLYLELSDLFAELYACQITNDYSGADQARYAIKILIAQRAYDLACYVANETTDTILATDLYSFRPSPEKIVHDIPDLTLWPKTASE